MLALAKVSAYPIHGINRILAATNKKVPLKTRLADPCRFSQGVCCFPLYRPFHMNMLIHNSIIPKMAKSINFSFRQPPVLQNPQEGIDGNLIIALYI